MTARRPQRVAYHLASSRRGTTNKWALGLLLIVDLTAASSLALCASSRHTPTRFYLCAAPFLHRSCCWPVVTDYSSFVPSSQTVAYRFPARHICNSPANAGFEFRALKLFSASLCPQNLQPTVNTVEESRVEHSLSGQRSTQGT